MKSGPRSSGPVSTHTKIYSVLRRVPRGRVVTYGQVATLAGLDGQPRLVGYALHALKPGTTLPWHRVINARGTVSIRSNGTASLSQRLLLEREGIAFDARGRVSLERYRWNPSPSTSRKPNRRGK
jgi:methylated-DNA-protein-cysteine methyltransferase related protein